MQDPNGSKLDSTTCVIIVNWNGNAYLKRCLSALSGQTSPPDQIIVIDNASTDGSTELITGHDPRITLIRMETNTGFAAANNIALTQAKPHTWTILLNPDAFAAPDFIQSLLASAEQHPDYQFFGARMLMADDDSKLDGTGDEYHASGLAWRRHHDCKIADEIPADEDIFSPCAAAAMYRNDILAEAGGFEESFFTYFEDIDLGFRLRLLGYRCRYTPDAVVHHVGSGVTGKKSNFSTYHGHRNLVWTWIRNMPAPLLWLYLPQHLLMNIAALTWFSLRGKSRPIWRAKRDALLGIPRALKARRKIQKNRKIGSMELRKLLRRGIPSRRC